MNQRLLALLRRRSGAWAWAQEFGFLAALLLAVWLKSAPSVESRAAGSPRVFVVTPALLNCRLRIGGKPGDLALQNRSVTAIVSQRDGRLVDFWRNTPTAASAPQLGSLSAIDGIWLFGPVLQDHRGSLDAVATAVWATDDGVHTRSQLRTGAGTVELTTSYRLDGDDPRLLITGRAAHVRGGRVAHLSLGDRFKWGNVDYYVDGIGKKPFAFHGRGRWVGRRGAGGDLLLRTGHAGPMRIDYHNRLHGSAAEITTLYVGGAIEPGQSLVTRRVLEYAPLPVAPEPPEPQGRLELTVTDERDRPLAAKLTFRGRDGTPDPDFGNDGDETGAGRFAWSGTGRFSRSLPPGAYEVLATAGIERGAARWKLRLEDGETVRLAGTLPRLLKTPGWIAADLHLHQAPSIDADIGFQARVIAIAAEGIEFAVASDHYVITDLAPTVRALIQRGALATEIQTAPGTEVSTVGHLFGHFNVFPLQPDDWIDYEDTTPQRLFAQVRAVAPDAILQVNHPRWSTVGYWHRYRLDPKTRRVPAKYRDQYDPHYEAVEVLNGHDVQSRPKFRQVLRDWMHLLGQGYRYTATGNSDSHKLFFVDPGVPRNLIHYGTAAEDRDDVRAPVAKLVKALRAGRVTVTTGPVLDVDIHGVGPGGTVPRSADPLPLRVRVRAAPWIDVAQVEVLVGQDARRVRWIPVPPSQQVVRLEETVKLRTAGKSFVVVVATGRRALPNVFLPDVKPLAFTNPIWVD